VCGMVPIATSLRLLPSVLRIKAVQTSQVSAQIRPIHVSILRRYLSVPLTLIAVVAQMTILVSGMVPIATRLRLFPGLVVV